MAFDAENMNPPGAKIKVFGIGGGGGNAVNTMIRANLEGVEFIAANTDIQALRFSLAVQNIQIGKDLTKGLGAGADPDVGRDAALEDRRDIENVLRDADMVFITAGMGGGTGTGGAAVIAQIARELGALTVAVVTKPFHFEGRRRRKHAELGIARLRESVDTLITIPNQRLLQIATPDLSMIDAFKMADNVLVNAVRGISDIINIPGTVNVDFADVKTVMSNMGHSLMGIGHAAGPKRAAEAARMAISSPLLEDIDIQGATGILINITAGSSITLMEVNEACSIIQDSAHEDANIIFGAVIDENLGDAIRVTVIATGFPVESQLADASHPTIVRPVAAKIFSTDYATGPRTVATLPNIAAQVPVTLEPNLAPALHFAPEPVLQAISEAHELAKWTIQHGETSFITQPVNPLADYSEADDLRDLHDFSAICDDSAVADELEISKGFEASEVLEVAETSGAYVWEEDFNGHVAPLAAPLAAPTAAPLAAPYDVPTPGVAAQSAAQQLQTNIASRIFDSSFDSDPVKPAAQEEAPMESFFEACGGLNITNEIDRKIDEALALAQRLRNAGASAKPQPQPVAQAKDLGDDDLDMPAFLRNGNSDIALD